MSQDFQTMTDEELRDHHNSISFKEGATTSVACLIAFALVLSVGFGIPGGWIDLTSMATLSWLVPSVAILVASVVANAVYRKKLNLIGAIQSERSRKYFAAVRRGRSYDPHEVVHLNRKNNALPTK